MVRGRQRGGEKDRKEEWTESREKRTERRGQRPKGMRRTEGRREEQKAR